MNDRFLYRAICNDGKFHHGYLARLYKDGGYGKKGDFCISNSAFCPYAYLVTRPETIGQCIGKKDIYGNLIYEGDLVCIVEYGDYDWERAIKRKQKVRKIKNLKIPSYNEPAFINLNHSQIIVWDNKRATFMMKDRINSTGRPESLCNKRYVIVGHIYENPELLESEER